MIYVLLQLFTINWQWLYNDGQTINSSFVWKEKFDLHQTSKFNSTSLFIGERAKKTEPNGISIINFWADKACRLSIVFFFFTFLAKKLVAAIVFDWFTSERKTENIKHFSCGYFEAILTFKCLPFSSVSRDFIHIET